MQMARNVASMGFSADENCDGDHVHVVGVWCCLQVSRLPESAEARSPLLDLQGSLPETPNTLYRHFVFRMVCVTELGMLVLLTHYILRFFILIISTVSETKGY